MSSLAPLTLALWMPQGWEWLIIAGFGLLFFGNRLPDVGRSVGQAIIQFKRGLRDAEDDINREPDRPRIDDHGAQPAKQIPASGDQPPEA